MKGVHVYVNTFLLHFTEYILQKCNNFLYSILSDLHVFVCVKFSHAKEGSVFASSYVLENLTQCQAGKKLQEHHLNLIKITSGLIPLQSIPQRKCRVLQSPLLSSFNKGPITLCIQFHSNGDEILLSFLPAWKFFQKAFSFFFSPKERLVLMVVPDW